MRHTSPNSGTTVDDSYLAKMIFDDSPQQLSPLVSTQKSPLHKSTSALHDISELPRLPSPSSHRQLTGTRSLAYPGSTSYLTDSNRSFNSSYYSDLNDSFYDPSSRASVASLGTSRYDESAIRGGNLADDLLQHYTHEKQSSPNGTPQRMPHGRSSLDGRSSYYPPTVPTSPYNQPSRSSPESFFSPTNHRSSYRSNSGAFSPEPIPPSSYPYHVPSSLSMRQRPHSTHSSGTPPPPGSFDYQRASSQPPHSLHNLSFKEREMDLQEALMMDQDEGTLV